LGEPKVDGVTGEYAGGASQARLETASNALRYDWQDGRARGQAKKKLRDRETNSNLNYTLTSNDYQSFQDDGDWGIPPEDALLRSLGSREHILQLRAQLSKVYS
jgi:hypothetical protein